MQLEKHEQKRTYVYRGNGRVISYVWEHIPQVFTPTTAHPHSVVDRHSNVEFTSNFDYVGPKAQRDRPFLTWDPVVTRETSRELSEWTEFGFWRFSEFPSVEYRKQGDPIADTDRQQTCIIY